MGLECNDDVEGGDDGDSGNERKSFGSVSCSICLETVADNGDRSWAKLQCGHQFHLDCIGSAFNAKGAMQCPNCRKIEKGQWLYANGSRSLPEFSMDDWVHDEELYDFSYSEMSFGVHWCPFGSMARLPSSFEEGEFSSNTYHHDFLGQHAVFPEQSAVSSASQPCPYVAYIGPIHPSSSNSSGSVSDGYTFSGNWNPSTPTDIPSSYAFPATDVHYHSWEHHHSPVFSTTSNRIGAPDQPPVPSISHRAVRTVSDLPRSGSSIHPFVLSHSANARAGGSLAYPGSNVRSHERTQALQAYYQQHQPSSSPAVQSPPPPTISRRSSGHRGLTQVVPGATSSDHSGGFYFIPSNASTRSFPDPETPPLSTRFHIWERDHVPSFSLNQADRGDGGWSALHQSARGSDPGSRAGSLWQRHGLERTSSQNHRP